MVSNQGRVADVQSQEARLRRRRRALPTNPLICPASLPRRDARTQRCAAVTPASSKLRPVHELRALPIRCALVDVAVTACAAIPPGPNIWAVRAVRAASLRVFSADSPMATFLVPAVASTVFAALTTISPAVVLAICAFHLPVGVFVLTTSAGLVTVRPRGLGRLRPSGGFAALRPHLHVGQLHSSYIYQVRAVFWTVVDQKVRALNCAWGMSTIKRQIRKYCAQSKKLERTGAASPSSSCFQ